MSLQPFNFIQAELTKSNWEQIVHALEYYIIDTEQKLIEENAGDAPWSNLEEYRGLREDLLTFVLSKSTL